MWVHHHQSDADAYRDDRMVSSAFFSAGSMYAFHSNGRSARPLRDEPVLFFDDGTRRGVTVEAAKDFAQPLSFPKIQSGGIRVVRQKQRIILCDCPF